MKFSLISTSAKILDQIDVESINIPTMQGEIQVLEHHLPVLGVTAPGVLRVCRDGRDQHYAIGAGIYEVDADGARVIADMVATDQHDMSDIEKRKSEAQKLMKQAQQEGLQNSEAYLAAEQEYLKQTALEQLVQLKR